MLKYRIVLVTRIVVPIQPRGLLITVIWTIRNLDWINFSLNINRIKFYDILHPTWCYNSGQLHLKLTSFK